MEEGGEEVVEFVFGQSRVGVEEKAGASDLGGEAVGWGRRCWFICVL